MWPLEVGSRCKWLQAVPLGFVQARRRNILARSVANKTFKSMNQIIKPVVDYINSLTRKHGTGQEHNQARYGLGTGKRQKVEDKDANKLNGRYAKNFGKEMLEGWLNQQFAKLSQDIEPVRFVSFQTPEWPRPPLDFCDTSGTIICHIKYTSYELARLDLSVNRGAAFPEWIRENMHLALGQGGLPGEDFFKCALMLYVDQFGDCAFMSARRADMAIPHGLPIEQTTWARVNFGKMQSAEEYLQGINFDFDNAWFFPSNYWHYIGRIPGEEMMNISTSWASKNGSLVYPAENLATLPIYQLMSPGQPWQLDEDTPIRYIGLD
jgi:hypothetical protein